MRSKRLMALARDRLERLEARRGDGAFWWFHPARVSLDTLKEVIALCWAANLAGRETLDLQHLSTEAQADVAANLVTPDDPYDPREPSRRKTPAEVNVDAQRSYPECKALLYWHKRREAARHG
jgi:hypothetical protein